MAPGLAAVAVSALEGRKRLGRIKLRYYRANATKRIRHTYCLIAT